MRFAIALGIYLVAAVLFVYGLATDAPAAMLGAVALYVAGLVVDVAGDDRSPSLR